MDTLKDINNKTSHKRLLSIVIFSNALVLIIFASIMSYVYPEQPTPKFIYTALYWLFGTGLSLSGSTLLERKNEIK